MSKLLPDVSLRRLVFRPNYARLQRSWIAGRGRGAEGERRGKIDKSVKAKSGVVEGKRGNE